MSLDSIRQSLQLGTLKLANRVIQAPLAGISCAPFRLSFNHYCPPGYAVTEMISGHSLTSTVNIPKRYIYKSTEEKVLAFQLSGCEPSVMYDATQVAAHYGADLIDLNVGCPKPKIRKKGCGSILVERPEKLMPVVKAMRKATNLPLTIKVRLHPQDDDYKKVCDMARQLEAIGVDGIVVHGRRYFEDYDCSASYQGIEAVVNAVSIPVIANGDVCDGKTLARCMQETGAAAVMIGRAGIGQPWVYQDLLSLNPIEVSAQERLDNFKRHVEGLVVIEGCEKVALHQARRLLKWYFIAMAQTDLMMCYQIETVSTLFDFLKSLLCTEECL